MSFGKYKRLLLVLIFPLVFLGVILGESFKGRFVPLYLNVHCNDYDSCMVLPHYDYGSVADSYYSIGGRGARYVGLYYKSALSDFIYKNYSDFYVHNISFGRNYVFATWGGCLSRLSDLQVKRVSQHNTSGKVKSWLEEGVVSSKLDLIFTHDCPGYSDNPRLAPEVAIEEGVGGAVIYCSNTAELKNYGDGEYAISCRFYDVDLMGNHISLYFNMSDDGRKSLEMLNKAIEEALSEIKLELVLFRAVSYFFFLGLFLLLSLLAYVCLKAFSWVRRG